MKIPENLLHLYTKIGFLTSLYVKLRWFFCQFEKIEERIPENGVILDIGCGYGILSNLLALKSEYRNVVGVDISKKRIDIARKTIGSRKNIEFLQANIAEIELKPCDAIIMSDFLHHIPYTLQEQILSKSREKLSENGILLIKEMDKEPFWKFRISYILDKLLNPQNRLYHQSSHELRELLENIGFDMKKTSIHEGTPFTDVIYECRKKRGSEIV